MLDPLSYIEISQKNTIDNYLSLKSRLSTKTKISCALKGNSYGHGQNQVAKILEDYADFYQVDDLQELRLLRAVTNKPVLVLGFVSKEELEGAVQLGGTMAIYDEEHLEYLNQIAEKLNTTSNIHLMIDAFLGREGILASGLEGFLSTLKKCPKLNLAGVYAHFSNIEDTSDFAQAQKQIDIFELAVKVIRDDGHKNFLTHISSTAGSLVYEKDLGLQSLVRLGIGIYGMWPSEDLKTRFQNNTMELKPVIRWVSHIAQIKHLPVNHPIGYGLTYITSKETTVAVIPQGYSDGYDRGLSNSGEVLIGGTRCRVLGRIAMNMFVVDVSHLSEVCSEDEVVLLGKQGDQEITAEEIALKINTINYEVTTRISPLLERIIV